MSKVSVHQRKARDFIQREDWGNALVELERMLEADRENPTLQNQVGDVYLRKEDVQRACEHFEQAIDLYAQVGLHNNAVALCKKVMRLRPGRFEMRYRLARLRFDQGFKGEASAYFRDYLDHVSDDDEYGPKLETNCREIVELLGEDAPLGKILEKLEVAQRYVAAYEIVRKLSQLAADSGDEPTARRYTEKLRSLRILVERSGGRDLLAEPAAAAPVHEPNQILMPPIAAPPAPPAPPAVAAVAVAADAPLVLEPTADPFAAARPENLLLEAPPAALDPLPDLFVQPPPAAGARDALDSILGSFGVDALVTPAEPEQAPAVERAVAAERIAPLPAPAPAPPSAPLPPPPPEAKPERSAAAASLWGDSQPLDVPYDPPSPPEYELPEGSFADLAQALGGEAPPAPSLEPALESDAMLSWGSAAAAEVEYAPEPEATYDDVPAPAAPAAWTRSTPPPTAPPAPQPHAAAPHAAAPQAAPQAPAPEPVPRVVQPFAAPASAAGWIEELRRAPVWIPTGDALVNPHPESDEGSNMELESVIDSFREQMARALDGDGAARYDLGVAYYEMGLYNEALAEFESAARCPGLEVQSFEMLAACLLQTGRHAEVVELLLPVLAADGHSPRGRLGLHYSMGLAYEALGDWQQAQRCFEEVALVDIDFKDVQTRLRRT